MGYYLVTETIGSCVLVLFVICQHELLFLKSLVIIQFQEIATFRQYKHGYGSLSLYIK